MKNFIILMTATLLLTGCRRGIITPDHGGCLSCPTPGETFPGKIKPPKKVRKGNPDNHRKAR